MEVIIFVLIFLGPLGLIVVLVNRHNNKKRKILVRNTLYYDLGIILFVISSLISPGFPVYLIYEWSKSVGSGSGLAIFFIVPFSFIAFMIGLFFFGVNNKRKTIEKLK